MEKRLPDEPGHWANDKGETCHIIRDVEGIWYVHTGVRMLIPECTQLNPVLEAKGIKPGRWKKMQMPEFEPLPELRAVLAEYELGSGKTTRGWFVQHGGGDNYYTGPAGVAIHGSRLRVVPHELNHPEAVKAIEDTF